MNTRKSRPLIGTLLLLLVATAQAVQTDDITPAPKVAVPGVYKGMPFLRARSHLIRSGWSPIRLPVEDHADWGLERDLVKRRILEFDACTVDRGQICAFYYRKGKACMRMETVGERLPWMRVTYWSAACPQPDRR